ncbi:YkgB family protein [Pricia sp.]|uniref:YkgB family protein n=1 Tax=Pricia sp. TaxID=2268138 RepID=UPI0035936217
METTANTTGFKLKNIGEIIIRYGLVIILLWVGALKFTTYEAEGIKPLVENSGLMSWGYDLMSVQAFSMLIGVIEIILGIMIATRYFAPKISAIGSIGTIIMALITLSFLLTTPGMVQKGYSFPSLSPMPGQFVAKDLLLLGAACWTAGEALIASKYAPPKTAKGSNS